MVKDPAVQDRKILRFPVLPANNTRQYVPVFWTHVHDKQNPSKTHRPSTSQLKSKDQVMVTISQSTDLQAKRKWLIPVRVM